MEDIHFEVPGNYKRGFPLAMIEAGSLPKLCPGKAREAGSKRVYEIIYLTFKPAHAAAGSAAALNRLG